MRGLGKGSCREWPPPPAGLSLQPGVRQERGPQQDSQGRRALRGSLGREAVGQEGPALSSLSEGHMVLTH